MRTRRGSHRTPRSAPGSQTRRRTALSSRRCAGSRLAPLENIRFDDSHTQVPEGLELSAGELAELRGEVARVAAERPWTNHRGWMGKVLDRAAARREASLSGEGVSCEGSKL